MSKIALLPGGFKPPHAGHYNMAKWLSANTDADTTIIFVGPKERDGITQNMSLKLWELYTQNDSGLEVRPAGVSPVRDVYDFIEQDAPEGSTVYLGMGEKDSTDQRYANIGKFAEPRGITFETKLVPPQAGGVSGTEMRGFIKMNDKALFQYSLPEHLSDEQKNKAWSIVTGLEEDLYNPEDKVLDYMRGSEWKAGMPDGPKDDIPRTKDQIHNRQKNPHAHMSEDAQSETGKILHAYDFDDTIAQVKANIRTTITSPSGDYNREILIPAANFPEESKELEARLGSLEIKYDFSEFEKQIGDAIVNSKVVNKLKDSLSRPEVKTTILTARSIGHPVTRYMREELGLAAYVVPLGLQVDGKVTGQDKADWIENHINKGYKTVYFIDDSEENRTAVAALKDKHPDVNLTVEDPAAVNEMMGMMNKQEKAKHAKNMKRLSKDMSNMKGNNYGGGGYKVPDYVKGTLTRKLYEEMSAADIDAVDTFADKQLNPVDVILTDKHFFDRLNDPRNKKEISGAELIGFFKRLARKKDEFVEFLTKYKELVVMDNRTNLNIPFMKLANKAIAKTVMRKKDFHTSSPSITLETTYGGQYSLSQHMDQIKKYHGHQQYRNLQTLMSQNKDEEVETWLKTKGYMNETAVFSKNWWKEQLTEVITETKANTHLTHLEELVLTQGQDGYNQARSFLFELIKNLKGQDNSIKNVSVKWDGAPALFTGINPDNGQFFVGTKGVFNVNPKINYTPQDIDTNHGHAPGLASKLKLALQYLPALGIKGILQGDFMFDNEGVETEDIDGVSHYTFKPNTIRYAVEANSELGTQIIAAKVGIIFHTTYNDLSGGGASFGADVSGLNKTSNVWFDDAYFKDATGVLLSSQEEEEVLQIIKEADSLNVDYNGLPDEISSRAKTNLLNTYLNSEVRIGEFIIDPYKSFERFKEWYKGKIEKAVAKISPKNQEKKRIQFEDKLRVFESKKDIVINLFKVSKLLSEAKSIFIAKYDKAVATKHFIDNGDGTLRVTKAEGFVAVDHTENGIKLVDRMEFSRNNFNAGKPGAKK